MQKCCITHYLALHGKNVILQLHYNYTLPLPPSLITTNVLSSNPVHGKVYSIQHYVIKFVSDLRHVGGFLLGTPVSSANKTDCHNITGTLLKVALNTKTINLCNVLHFYLWSLHHCVFKTFVLEVSRDRHAQLCIASLDKWTFEYTILFGL
jgi:hypothetical protein